MHANESESHGQSLAPFVVALYKLVLHYLVFLSEVQGFVRVQMLPNRISKFLIRYFSISINIKLIKNVFKLLVIQVKAPAFEQVL